MKTLLIIFALYWISGPVGGFDVIGYSGGSVKIYCYHQKNHSNRYFCKSSANRCLETSRIEATSNAGYTLVTMTSLKSQDGGTYRCGESSTRNHNINLMVIRDPCCSEPKSMVGYLGESVTINCYYQEEFQTNDKYFYKLSDREFIEVIRSTNSQKGRFSISDNRSSRVFSVRIRDVIEDDKGVYYCGVWGGGNSVQYTSIYREIVLSISGGKGGRVGNISNTDQFAIPTSSGQPDKTSTNKLEFSCQRDPTVVIITACVCVTLVLIGGLAVIFYIIKHRSVSSGKNTKTNDTADGDYVFMQSRIVPTQVPPTTASTPTPTNKIHPTRPKTPKPATSDLSCQSFSPKPKHVGFRLPEPQPKPQNQPL
ncbi:uncharacterized protein LOC103024738 [Astyanax mexicanus]|uniref:uncharacterized protein LOC103024738 n=1 Tax=Astyanax mexicanus TaxID=7994 RepID=UPI0020CAB27C|nr:uncharacterized protein LOC103024738 [Astyanax mexicanus]